MNNSVNNGLRVAYAGTPDFAVPALKALLTSKHSVVGVFTQPDRPSGRGRKLIYGPVKQAALEADVEVYQPESFKTAEAQALLQQLNVDVMVVAAYGLILPQAALDIPRYGCLNIHGSLLPAWRGAAPIQRAIQAGDEQTGVTIMQMAKGLDTGDMLHKTICPISASDTGQTIHDRLAEDGAQALLDVLDQLQQGRLSPEPQQHDHASYAHKLNKAEAEIDWSQPAEVIDRQIRAFNPWPIAFTTLNNQAIKCLMSHTSDKTVEAPVGSVINESKSGIEVATAQGTLLITQLQLPGKKAMHARDFLNGRSLLGERLGS